MEYKPMTHGEMFNMTRMGYHPMLVDAKTVSSWPSIFQEIREMLNSIGSKPTISWDKLKVEGSRWTGAKTLRNAQELSVRQKDVFRELVAMGYTRLTYYTGSSVLTNFGTMQDYDEILYEDMGSVHQENTPAAAPVPILAITVTTEVTVDAIEESGADSGGGEASEGEEGGDDEAENDKGLEQVLEAQQETIRLLRDQSAMMKENNRLLHNQIAMMEKNNRRQKILSIVLFAASAVLTFFLAF